MTSHHLAASSCVEALKTKSCSRVSLGDLLASLPERVNFASGAAVRAPILHSGRYRDIAGEVSFVANSCGGGLVEISISHGG